MQSNTDQPPQAPIETSHYTTDYGSQAPYPLNNTQTDNEEEEEGNETSFDVSAPLRPGTIGDGRAIQAPIHHTSG